MANDFAWLHISDLHAGQANQDWLWPTLKSRFYEDLRRIQPNFEKLDFVVFSGDLTQSASKEDFLVLEETLNRLWDELGRLGSTPQLFMVPGNHDLERPGKYDSRAIAMKSWWTNPDVKEAFWKTTDNEFRQFTESLFSNYSEFVEKLKSSGFPVFKTETGSIPGDCSVVFSKGEFSIGLVGLNTSYLHFFDDPKNTGLDLDPRQLLAVTGNKPDEWCRSNDLNFLITHHPANWLHKGALPHFHGEIYPPDRFTAHLFGHMHQPDYQYYGSGGSTERRLVQAASLFGLRKIEGMDFDRIHGYCASTINIASDGARIKFWPRIGEVVGSGVHRFVPNNKLDLEEQNYFAVDFKRKNPFSEQKSFAISSEQLSFMKAEEQAVVERNDAPIGNLFTQLKSAPAHQNIRTLEQKKLQRAIENHSAAWVIADWNYCADEFIWAAISSTHSNFPSVYRFSLSDYSGRESFFTQFSQETGRSFQEFAKSIIDEGSVLFLLDDAPTDRGIISGSSACEPELESIAEAFLDYCPNINILLLARQKPISAALPIVELEPFEEPDVRTYIVQSSGVASQYTDSSAISDIYRLTEGIPTELDVLIKQLEYTSLSEIIEERLNHPKSGAALVVGADGIFSALEKLRSSEEPLLIRAFNLLKALSVLPYGETLGRIRHFDAPHPFHTAHASILADRGFIEVQPVSPTIAAKNNTPQSPKLRVKKAVREEVLKPLSASEIYELNRKAASIYFGEQWLQGAPKNIKTTDLTEALGGGGLGNPHTVINALLQHAAETNEFQKFKKAVDLARLLLVSLDQGNNFRAAVSCCQDFLKLIPDVQGNQADINWLKFKMGAATRMLGDRVGSSAIFSQMDLSKFDKPTRLKILINWAMAEQNSNPEHAIEIAKQIITIGKATFQAMEAQALILQNSPEDLERFNKLRVLEKKARGKKAITAANNIALFLSLHSNASIEEKRSNLRSIALSAKSHRDAYSAARATIRLGKLVRENDLKSSPDEVSGMIATYHYLYQERLSEIFTDSHDILWWYFLKTEDVANLIRLYRHSSFVWRLYGEDQKEAPYAKSLLGKFPDLLIRIKDSRSIEADYFSIRAEKFQLLLGRS